MSSGLSYTVTHSDDVSVVYLDGEIDLATGDDFATQLRSALTTGSRRLVVDMTKVSFLGSAGLAALMSISKQAAQQGTELHLVCSPATKRTIELIGLSGQFTLVT
jgi:anti-sigma B factor antagonist